MRLLSASATTLLTAVGCGEGGEAPAGILNIDALDPLALTEEVRIGDVDDPDAGFSSITSVAVTDEGEIFVVDAQAREVRVFGPDGRRRRTFGRRGEGPGEFSSLPQLYIFDDTVWTLESPRGKVNVFALDGTFVETYTIPRITIDVGRDDVRMSLFPAGLRDDGLWGSSWSTSYAQSVPNDSFPYPNILFDRRGEVADTEGVRWFTFGSEPIEIDGVNFYVSTGVYLPSFPATRPPDSVRVSAPGWEEGTPTRLRIVRTGAGGDTIYARELAYEPVPLAAQYADSVLRDRYRSRAEGTGIDLDRIVRILLEHADLPAYHPPVSRIFMGKDRSVWLRRENVEGEETRWLVLDPDGAVRGHAPLPRSAVIREARGDLVWVTEDDAYGVPWVVRYRVEGG